MHDVTVILSPARSYEVFKRFGGSETNRWLA